MRQPFTIAGLDARPLSQAQLLDVERIFFTSSATQSFADENERVLFRARWLGRYLDSFPGCAFVAKSGDEIVGYLAGADVDPANSALFSDITYFSQFAELMGKFPAHFHVNVSADHRGAGIGSALIEAFVHQLSAHGIAGVHVVTLSGARNVAFYRRSGFSAIKTAADGRRELLFLGRKV